MLVLLLVFNFFLFFFVTTETKGKRRRKEKKGRSCIKVEIEVCCPPLWLLYKENQLFEPHTIIIGLLYIFIEQQGFNGLRVDSVKQLPVYIMRTQGRRYPWQSCKPSKQMHNHTESLLTLLTR